LKTAAMRPNGCATMTLSARAINQIWHVGVS
jgi:hypothetical protein